MPSNDTDPPSNVTERRQPLKRKRETAASRLASKSSRTSTPNAYARRSPPRDPDPPQKSDEAARSPPRKLKRPGAGARINTATLQAAQQARDRKEEEERKATKERQANAAELVANHYNAVPERGREWRKTDSQIKGLRSLNNWIKSTLIQKFSRPDIPAPHLCVLDMACGKGGDLGKWERAPQVPSLYVGCDIAGVSVDQARQRWQENLRKSSGRYRRGPQMQAEFFVHDAFGRPVGELPIVREVGFDPNAGPGPAIIQGGTMSGGFDVVSMMFALHYSFETEVLAKGMLKNVAGALKKGGRFIGVMPNSDVISATMKRLLSRENADKASNGASTAPDAVLDDKEEGEASEAEDDWDPEKPSEPKSAMEDGDEDDWDPEKPSEPVALTNGTSKLGDEGGSNDNDDDDWDPEKPSEPNDTTASKNSIQTQSNGTSPTEKSPAILNPDIDRPPLQWGNSIYTVRFPRKQPLVSNRPLPKDGIFRPPYGWRYHYQLEEAVDVPEYVVPWEGFRALAEDYGLELMYRKGFREVFEDESEDMELGILAERMGVMSRDRSQGRKGLLVSEEEMEAAGFYHAFCFYKT